MLAYKAGGPTAQGDYVGLPDFLVAGILQGLPVVVNPRTLRQSHSG